MSAIDGEKTSSFNPVLVRWSQEIGLQDADGIDVRADCQLGLFDSVVASLYRSVPVALPKKIVIYSEVMSDGFGDLARAAFVYEFIRAHFPTCELHVVCGIRQLETRREMVERIVDGRFKLLIPERNSLPLEILNPDIAIYPAVGSSIDKLLAPGRSFP